MHKIPKTEVSEDRLGKRQNTVDATEDDLYYAYRLLLGREPDAPGWKDNCRLISEKQPTVQDLAKAFMATPEFGARHIEPPAPDAPLEVSMGDYSLFIRSGDHHIGQHIRSTHQYEPHVTAAVRKLLRPGGTFIDVGANIGFFTNMAAHLVGPGGLVVAVEPMDKNVQLIFLSLAKNGFGNVRVHVCAASDREQLVSIVSNAATSNGQVVDTSKADSYAVLAQTRRLDDLTADVQRVDLLKLDIEGYELFAWRGFREGLEKHRPIVLAEFHPYCMRRFTGIDPFEYLDEIFAYGRTVQVLTPRGDHIACTTPAKVMEHWEKAGASAAVQGTQHLDLLIHPRA